MSGKNAGCTNSTQCLITGTSCQTHGPIQLCIPTDKTRCNNVDALFVAAVKDVYTMFCSSADIAKVSTDLLADNCESYETSHRGVCLLPECTTAQVAANSKECWVSELPSGAVAAPTTDQGNSVPRTECSTSAQCKSLVAGTSCIKHGNLNLCIPDDRSNCVAVDPLYVTSVSGVYTMFCNQAAPVPNSAINQTCATYEGSHGGLCLLPACTQAQIAAGSKQCWLETLPGTQLVEVQASTGSSSGSSGLSSGAIAGIVIGVLALVAMVIGGLVYARRKRWNSSTVGGSQHRLDNFNKTQQGDTASTTDMFRG